MIEYIVVSLTAAGAFALTASHARIRVLKAKFMHLASKLIPLGDKLSIEVRDDGTLLARSRGYVRATRFIVVEEPSTTPRRLDDQELGRLSRKFASIVYSAGTDTVVTVLRSPLDTRKMLRDLEKKILNLRLTLEYNPEDKSIERKLRVLEAMHSRIIGGEKPSRSKILVGVRYRDKDQEACVRRVKAEADALLSTLETLGLRARAATREEVYTALLAAAGLAEPEERATHLETDIAYVGPALLARTPSGRGIYLGKDIETGAPFFYDLQRYGTRHIAVVGPTGRGKTTLLRVLTARSIALLENLKSLVIDFKGDLAPRLTGTIPLVNAERISFQALAALPPGYPTGAWAYLVLESIKTAVELEAEEEHALYSAMISSLSSKGIVDREIVDRVSANTPRLASKLDYIYGKKQDDNTPPPLYSAYDLSLFPGDQKNLYASLILARLVADIESSPLSEQLGRLIVVDEAWRLTRGGGAVVKRLVKEARSYGVSVVLATQNIEDLPPEILDNTGTFIAFGSPAEEYLDKVARYASLNRFEVERLKWFATGDALIRLYDDPRPFWIHVDPVLA